MIGYKGYTGPKKSGFVFGGDTGISHEQLQTKRRIADALAANVGRTPRNVGEGLTAIGNALMYRGMMNQIDEGEAQGQSKAHELILAALQGREPKPYASSTGPMTMLGIPPRTEEQVIGDDAMAALGKTDAMSDGGYFAMLEQQHGLPSGYLTRTAQIESGGNPNAQNSNSSAGGMFQFIDSTAQQYGLTDKTDVRASASAAARLAADNTAHLRQVLGREPTAAELYLAHQQGAGGAATLLSNPNANAASLLGNDAVMLNGGKSHMTAAEFANKWTGKFGGAAPEPQRADYSAFYKALNSPWVSQEQKAMLMAELDDRRAADDRAYDRWAQANDPMRQMQLEKARLEIERMQNPPEEKTALMRNYEAAVEGGYQGDIVQYQTDIKKAGAAQNNITVGLGPNGEQTPYSQPVTPAQEKVDEEFAKTYVPWSQGGGADMASQIAQIETVADQLENGSANLTGPVLGSLPDFIGAATHPKAVAARETVENVVQRNLRLLLGAQFTAKEGEQLIARAYNARLPEAENAKRLRRLSLAMKAAAQDTQSQVDYYQKNGTLTGWEGRQWTIADFEAAIEGGDETEPPQQQQSSRNGPKVGTIEDGYRFLGGDPQNPENWEQVN